MTCRIPKRLKQEPLIEYRPRTALRRKLIALRRAHILAWGKLLGWDEIDEEVRPHRGGIRGCLF